MGIFNPKTGLYLEDPVACVDYSSLYPSSIISENLSPDSKVWTKEYDLSNNLIQKGTFLFSVIIPAGFLFIAIFHNLTA